MIKKILQEYARLYYDLRNLKLYYNQLEEAYTERGATIKQLGDTILELKPEIVNLTHEAEAEDEETLVVRDAFGKIKIVRYKG